MYCWLFLYLFIFNINCCTQIKLFLFLKISQNKCIPNFLKRNNMYYTVVLPHPKVYFVPIYIIFYFLTSSGLAQSPLRYLDELLGPTEGPQTCLTYELRQTKTHAHTHTHTPKNMYSCMWQWVRNQDIWRRQWRRRLVQRRTVPPVSAASVLRMLCAVLKMRGVRIRQSRIKGWPHPWLAFSWYGIMPQDTAVP